LGEEGEQMARKPVSLKRTKNFLVEDYRNPPKRQVLAYRSKKTKDDHVLTVAVLKKEGPRGGRTVLTSLKHPKGEKRAVRRT
jgi:hypothetical protein